MLALFSYNMLLFAQDYSFEIPGEDEENEERLEWGGNLDGKYALFHPQRSSPIYELQFADAETSSNYLSQYQLDFYLDGDYQTKDIGFHVKTHVGYLNDTEEVIVDLFELYGNFNLSLSSFIQAGKIRYSWGKGYAFNPVGFVNPLKDPTNPTLAKAGVLSLNAETLKSFQSNILKTAALTAIVIPPQEEIYDRFAEVEDTDFAAKLYLMLWNIDFDLMGYYSKENSNRIGADFALNLRENIELHGEFSYFTDALKSTIVNNQLLQTEEEGYAYLVGMRWLNRWGITTILEYYHTDASLTEDEFQEYLRFLRQSLDSRNEEQIKRALAYSQNFKGNTLMQDYMYFQVQKPEPFDWLYFTPSFSTIYNLNDKSMLLALTFTYKPVTNFEFALKPTVTFGKEDSEYGSQRIQQKVETWLRFYF